jgi:hypothetical protein
METMINQPVFQVALPLMVTILIAAFTAVWSSNKRIEEISRLLDDTNRRFDRLGDGTSQRFDHLESSINQRLDRLESSIQEILKMLV